MSQVLGLGPLTEADGQLGLMVRLGSASSLQLQGSSPQPNPPLPIPWAFSAPIPPLQVLNKGRGGPLLSQAASASASIAGRAPIRVLIRLDSTLASGSVSEQAGNLDYRVGA